MNKPDLRLFTYRAALNNVVYATVKLAEAVSLTAEAARAYDPDPASTAPGPDDAAVHATIDACRAVLRPMFLEYPGAAQMLGVEPLPEMLAKGEE